MIRVTVIALVLVGAGCSDDFAEVSPAQLSVEPDTASFQAPLAGSFESETTLTVKNTGGSALTIDSVTLTEDDDTVELAILDADDWTSGQKTIPGQSQEELTLRWTVLDAQTDTGTLTIATNGGTVEVPISTVDLDPEVQYITTPPGSVEGQTTTVALTRISAGQRGRVTEVIQSIGAVPLTVESICFLDGDGACQPGQTAANGAFTLCDGTPDDPAGCAAAGTDEKLRAQETYTFSVVFHPPAGTTDTQVAQVLITTDAGQQPTATLLVQGIPCVRSDDTPICGTCGDGTVDDGEECDDGNVMEGDACRNNCLFNTCGDGVVDATEEECDDANDDDADACTNSCTEAACGDSVVYDGVEECDDGNTDDDDDCVGLTCAVAFCGDGFVRSGQEACDDGDNDSLDGCSEGCIIEHGFDCFGVPSECESTCGDGLVAADEECDDRNTEPRDGCSDTCTIEIGFDCEEVEPSICVSECGDGVVAADEECDDRNLEDDDGCNANCEVEFGFICDGSPSICASECGDGLKASDEACDDGDENSDVVANVCRNDCTLPTCGDGVTDDAEPYNEQCDEEIEDVCVCRPDCTEPISRNDNLLISNIGALQTHGDLERIRGNLVLRNIATEDVQEVLNVACIEGDLIVNSNGMAHLGTLSNLVDVRGSVTVSSNRNLTTLDGLDALSKVGGTLSIDTNVTLQNLDGLGRITGPIDGDIRISNNRELTNISGLRGITSADDITVDSNDILNVNGLESVETAGSVSIASNPQLRHVDGLSSLTTVAGQLRIASNPQLASATGLMSLVTVEDGLILDGNPALEEIDLSSLESVGASVQFISHAELMSLSLPALVEIGGQLRLVSNIALISLDAPLLVTPPTALVVVSHNVLPDLSGLSSLSGVIPGEVSINTNTALQSLDGLAGVDGVEGRLSIVSNCQLPQPDGEAFASRLNPQPSATNVARNGDCLD